MSNTGGGQITLHWIPSHVGIPLNETADSLAFRATSKPSVDVYVSRSKSQLKHQALQTISATWTRTVDHASLLSKSIQWKRSTSPNGFIPPLNTLRHIETRLFRLILGYRCSWEIAQRSQRQCEHCDSLVTEPLIHFILHCPSTKLSLYLTPHPPIVIQQLNDSQRAANQINLALQNIKELTTYVSRFSPPR